jgi:broad specificity phosphatase PhoE
VKAFLFRHAEKELGQNFISRNNPGLSPAGHKQAQSIVKLFTELEKQDPLTRPEVIISSPKIRAVQTLTPLAEKFGIKIQLSEELFERHSTENAQEFLTRVKNFIEWLPSLNKTTCIVTHFDWIEDAMVAIPCDSDLNSAEHHHWSPAQSMEFKIEDELWHLLQQREVPL